MQKYQIGGLITLVGVIWYLVLAWRSEHKKLALIGVAYLAAGAAIVSGKVHGQELQYVSWAEAVLGLVLLIGSLVNIGTFIWPLVAIVGGSWLYYKERPTTPPGVERVRDTVDSVGSGLPRRDRAATAPER